jgi:hypothetical protein
MSTFCGIRAINDFDYSGTKSTSGQSPKAEPCSTNTRRQSTFRMTKGDWNQRQKARRVSDTRGANGHAETRRKTMGEGSHRVTEAQRKTKGGGMGHAETRRRGGGQKKNGRQGCRGLGLVGLLCDLVPWCEVWSSGSGALLGTGRLRSAECECRWIG